VSLVDRTGEGEAKRPTPLGGIERTAVGILPTGPAGDAAEAAGAPAPPESPAAVRQPCAREGRRAPRALPLVAVALAAVLVAAARRRR
jgi:hypothetical protein